MSRKTGDSAINAARVLIVDDHPVVREGLSIQIATQADLKVCGEAEDVPEALALVDSARPDVAIVDIALKNSSGLDLIRRIRDRNDSIRILVWSMYPESLYAERVLRAGAQGYLHKGQATYHLLHAIRAVLAGKVYVSDEFSEKLLSRMVGGKLPHRSPIESLSDRELQVFEMMGQGLITETIAAKMRVSPKTVDTYRARIKEKLDVANVNELVQRATQWVLENK